MKEAAEVAKHRDPHFILMFDETDILRWRAYVQGPDDTPYSEGIFEVLINLTSEYPVTPPKLYFKTRTFHPNIHWESGEVCLDIIKAEWTPAWTLEGLCRAIRYLLENPNADSPLNCDCGNLLRCGDLEAYKAMAKMYTGEYALDKSEFKRRLTSSKDKSE